MNLHLWPRFKRFWHTLFRFHRAMDYSREESRVIGFGSWTFDITTWPITYIGCECGKSFWEDPQHPIKYPGNRK